MRILRQIRLVVRIVVVSVVFGFDFRTSFEVADSRLIETLEDILCVWCMLSFKAEKARIHMNEEVMAPGTVSLRLYGKSNGGICSDSAPLNLAISVNF